MTWTTSSFVITAKTKVTRDASLRITRKTSSSIQSQRCSLYDKCHIKTEYDMNYRFICDYCKNESHSRSELKNHKKNFIINLKPRCPLYDICHIKKEYDMTPISVVITVKMKITQNASFKNHQRDFIINSRPRCPLDDKCHIKTENDMNYKFIVIIAKWDSHHKRVQEK